jgi:hypothetical protein
MSLPGEECVYRFTDYRQALRKVNALGYISRIMWLPSAFTYFTWPVPGLTAERIYLS